MGIMKLKSGQFLVSSVYEILAIPESENIAEQSDAAKQKVEREFYNLLAEGYRYCLPSKAVLEIFWLAKKVSNQLYSAKVHLYFVIRLIEDTVKNATRRRDSINKAIEEHLVAGLYEIRKIEDETAFTHVLPESDCMNAIIKTEKCDVHSQALFPYYYAKTLPIRGTAPYSMLSKTMSDMPDSFVSFQLFPQTLLPLEIAAVNEMQSNLNKAVLGMTLGPGNFYRDQLAAPAQQVYQYIGSQIGQPMFTYNILAGGTQYQCADLSAKIISFIKESGNTELSTINVNAEKISLKKQFPYYPWNLNKHLISTYRNNLPWQVGGLPRALYRMPYFITLEEATTFFRLPIDNNDMSGIRSRKIIQNTQQIDERVFAKDNVQLGQLVGADESAVVGCSPKSLTKHMLVVGKPGTGKTTFSVHLLLQLARKGVPFLAIEPTKAEYRAMIDSIPDLQIFTPGNNSVSPFVINPFIPPRGITVEQFIPSLASAFKAAFSMPSPLDTIFQAAIQEAYIQYGWKDYSTAQDPNVVPFGLHEFILVFKRLVNREHYSAEVKGNLQSGGVLRLRNLIEQNANIYDTTKTIPIEDLLSKPTVLELNAIDNQEQKSVLMALLLINICVYTKHNNINDGKLKNVILIDEAHVLFKGAGSSESSNSTVRSLENMLAEIRSFGTAIVIADQSPTAVGNEVVKNTEVKTVFQLVDDKDRQTIASTTGMSEEQARHIQRLNVGEAFVSFGMLPEPVLIRTPDIRDQEGIRLSVNDSEVHHRMIYWNDHDEYLIPFRECGFSSVCCQCQLKMRSDAAFYASRFIQMFGSKITDFKTLHQYLSAVDGWLAGQLPSGLSEQQTCRMRNCVKIRLLRRLLQQKDIEISQAKYNQLLEKLLKSSVQSEPVAK